MAGKIIINVSPEQTRVALLDTNALLSELYIERKKDASLVGNVYKGKVVKILPGMQSAFVKIGLERDAFLYVSDVLDETAELESGAADEEGDEIGANPAQASIAGDDAGTAETERA